MNKAINLTCALFLGLLWCGFCASTDAAPAITLSGAVLIGIAVPVVRYLVEGDGGAE